jgi:uncharacterized membrane protein YhhN
MNELIVIAAVIVLAVLLFFEKREAVKIVLPVKTLLSGMFIATVTVQPHPIPSYYYFILIGLVFCLFGDVCLALPQEKMFIAGLVSFLMGHLFYVAGFFWVSDINRWTWLGAAVMVCASVGAYLWLRPGLGKLHIPVVCYIIVITLMMIGAWSLFGDLQLLRPGRIVVLTGAAAFYVSDLFVGRDRFLKSGFVNRSIGLPLYYLGQFFLAFSVGLI